MSSKVCWLMALAACGGDDTTGSPAVTVTTSFVASTFQGNGPSPLDALRDRTIDIEIVFPVPSVTYGDESDTPECKSTVIYNFPPERTARGEAADVVQTQILDMLALWDLRLQLCTTGRPTLILHAEIEILNLAFACFGVPASAMVRDGDGNPRLTSFVATDCNATILDVVNNRIIGNPNFTMTVEVGNAP